MNCKKCFRVMFFSVLNLLGSLQTFSQEGSDPQKSIINLTPASPNAASLGQYGNVPIGMFTGIPNINIPLTEIGAGKIKMPVSLSYHGGGIKVEEIASWVGLGWSLNAGGVITRSVRGIPDDIANGFFNQPMKVKFMLENGLDPVYSPQIKTYLRMAGQDQYDTEADIFYFNFGSQSGKFFFDQEANEFYTIPRSNAKISFDAGIKEFVFTDEGGMIYYFGTHEQTTRSSSFCTGSSTAPPSSSYGISITAWYLSRIENADATETMSFDYIDQNYSNRTGFSSTSYILQDFSGISYDNKLPTMAASSCYQQPDTYGKKLIGINFKNGSIHFTSNKERCDLLNNQALEKIELWDETNSLVKRFVFDYGYFGDIDNPTNCDYLESSYFRRLKLKNVWEENEISGVITKKPGHIFTYSDILLPGRLSFAQDHWGYYNGANGNQTLIPPYIQTKLLAPPVFWPGADRKVNSSYNQACALTKISYPTGGSTEFEFECNEVNEDFLEPVLLDKGLYIEGDHIGNQNYYESAEFTINVPPGPSNGNSPNGGVLASIEVAGLENCGYGTNCPPPTSCAVLNVAATGGGAISWGALTCSMTNHYLPNGTYKLTASFNQPGFEDFFFLIRWKEVDETHINSQLVGGIRVKTTKDYDGINHANDIIKKYSYTNEEDNISSGQVSGKPRNYTSDYQQVHYSGIYLDGVCTMEILNRNFIKRNSYSNYPLLTSSGGYVGYGCVTVSEGTNSIKGKAIYKYRTGSDLYWEFPFPSMGLDQERGQLINEKIYRKNNAGVVELIKETMVDYLMAPVTVGGTNLQSVKTITALKTGFKRDVSVQSDAPCIANSYPQTLQEFLVPNAEEYETRTSLAVPYIQTTTIYDQGDNSKSATTTTHTGYSNNNFSPSVTIDFNSKGETIKTIIKYPKDFSFQSPGSSEALGIANLKAKNLVTAPVEKYVIKKLANGQEFVVSALFVKYKADQPLADKIYELEINAPIALSTFVPAYFDAAGNLFLDVRYKERVNFYKYDLGYNILEQQKTNDITKSYIWGLENPIAECINALEKDIAYTSFEPGAYSSWAIDESHIISTSFLSGKKSYNINGSTIIKSNLTLGNYLVSYWSNGSSLNVNGSIAAVVRTVNGWNLYQHILNGITNVSISGVCIIDELKLHPIQAQMTSYTYKSMVGLSSQNDPNNRILFYEYDVLNRLSFIRDQDNNILKKICYNYAGQVEDCPVTTNTTPQWNSTGQTRCQPCAANSIYNSGVKEKEEKDMNPNSPSGGNYHWVVDPTGTCPTPAVWSDGFSYCEQNPIAPYEFTGNLITNQGDVNPCSLTYNQVRQIIVPNAALCPVCSPACNAPQYKCINGVCTAGLWKIVKVRQIIGRKWECISAWCFPDGTISNYTQTVTGTTPCNIECF